MAVSVKQGPTAGSGANATIAFAGNVTTGNLVVLLGIAYNGNAQYPPAVPSNSGTAVLSWQGNAITETGIGGLACQIAWATVTTGGSCTVTTSTPGTGNCFFFIWEVQGSSTGWKLDGTPANGAGSGPSTPPTAGPIIASGVSGFAMAGSYYSGAASGGPPGWTFLTDGASDGIAYTITTPGSYTATFTPNDNGWIEVFAIFAPISASPKDPLFFGCDF